MTRKQKKTICRILASTFLFIMVLFLQSAPYHLTLTLYFLAYMIVGYDVIMKAIRNIGYGQLFDEHLLMTLATLGAFYLSEYPEGVSVMLFYQIGELFQSIAVNKSRRSISELMDIRPEYANKESKHSIIKVRPDEIAISDTIVIYPGEKIPLDGTIIEGSSTLDMKNLTGESIPQTVSAGTTILSGGINLTGVLRVQVSRLYQDSTVSKILELVENASSKKTKSETFITKFSRWYTPCIVFGAFFLAMVPPSLIPDARYGNWLHRALIFLVISCPCALLISVPLTFFGAIGAASKAGILVKGSNYLEALAKAKTIVFDKTGTLTKGTFQVTNIIPHGISKKELLFYAAHAELYSTHPISLSLKNAISFSLDRTIVKHAREISGQGVKATVNGHQILVGNAQLMTFVNHFIPNTSCCGTTVYVAIDNTYAGRFLIMDELRSDAKRTIRHLKHDFQAKTVLLTGDCSLVGCYVANELGIDEVHTNLLPSDKVKQVELLFANSASKGSLVYVGDGINDAPVLTRADVGIAMGSIGSDAAIEAADVVLMTDEPAKLLTAISISKKALRIAYQNIYFALTVKLLVLVLGSIGLANMWEAVFADVGVSVLSIVNATRMLKSIE